VGLLSALSPKAECSRTGVSDRRVFAYWCKGMVNIDTDAEVRTARARCCRTYGLSQGEPELSAISPPTPSC
jgi:hypothetical protein